MSFGEMALAVPWQVREATMAERLAPVAVIEIWPSADFAVIPARAGIVATSAAASMRVKSRFA